MKLKTKQGLSIGLSIIGAGGTIATALLVRESAKKEVNDYESLLPFKKGNIKDILNIYKLPIVVGLATVSSIVASTILNRRAEASLMSVALMADQGWRKYKNQVKSTLGIDKHTDVLKGIAKDTLSKKQKDDIVLEDRHELFYDEIIGYFQALPEDVAYAYAEINELMNTNHGTASNDVFEGVTLADFISAAKAKLISNPNNDLVLNSYGWSIDYLSEVHDDCWIHMGFSEEVTDDGIIPYKVINWAEEPILLGADQDPNMEYADLDMFLDDDELGKLKLDKKRLNNEK